MAFANAAKLGCRPGRRDDLVVLLTRRSEVLRELGCQLYEVGTDDDEPDTVFVLELWNSADDHARSLQHPDVQAALESARPLLSGEFGGFHFLVSGSPLRS